MNEARPWSESSDGRKKITCEEPADGRLLCRVEEEPAGRPFPQFTLPAPRARMRGEQLGPVLTPLFQWSPRGTFVYVYRPWWGADGPVRQDGLYDLSSRQLRRPFGAGGEPLRTEPGSPMGAGDVPATRLPLSPDDRFFARETNGGIAIHDAMTGREIVSLARASTLLAWRPDASQIVAGRGADAAVFDLPSGAVRYELPAVAAVAWSHDGSTLAALDRASFRIRLHDARDGRELRRLRASPSGKRGGPLVFTRDDAFVVHQTIENGFRVHRLADDATLSIRVVLTRKGRYAAVAHTDDGVVDGAIEGTEALLLTLDGRRTSHEALKERLHRPTLLADFWGGRPISPSGFRAILPDLDAEPILGLTPRPAP